MLHVFVTQLWFYGGNAACERFLPKLFPLHYCCGKRNKRRLYRLTFLVSVIAIVKYSLYASSSCSYNNCVTTKMYATVEFYHYIISPIWPIFHVDSSLCLTKPHSVWVHLMEIISWVHLHTMAGSSISQRSHLSLQAAALQSWSEGTSLRKYNTAKLSQPLVCLA